MSNSVVFQAYSETGEFGVDFAIIATAVVEVLRRRGLSAFVRNEGLEGIAWAAEHGVPEASDEELASCEVLLRAWPAGSWPTRPADVRTVVDFVRHAADRSHAADFTVAFEADDTPPFAGLIVWDVLFPLPIAVNEVVKEIQDGVVVIHLGQDTLSRVAGLFAAIDGYNGLSAVGLLYPEATPSAGSQATAFPWNAMGSGDVAVVTAEFPVHLAAGLRIPAILVAATSGEGVRCEELVSRGHSSFLYLGLLSGLTNNQVRNAVYDLVNDDSLKRIMRLGGNDQRARQGVMRISNWVERELIGRELHRDPFHVQGYDSILDPQEKVPLNANDSVADQGGVLSPEEEAEVQVQVFTADGTWSKPDGAKMVHVEAIAGGNGGGSGERNTGTRHGGGGGGAGGKFVEGWFPADALPAEVPVLVGQGGIGGAGVTVDTTVGNDGSPGGDSEFGDFLAARNVAEDRVTPDYPFDNPWTIFGTGGNSVGTLPPTGSIPGESGFPGVHKHEYNLDDDMNSLLNTQGANLVSFPNTWSSNGGVAGNGPAGGIGSGRGSDGGLRSAGGGGGGGGIDLIPNGEPGADGGDGSLSRGVPLAAGTGGTLAQQDGGGGDSVQGFACFGGGGGGGGSSEDPTFAGAGGPGGFPGGGGGGGGASLNGVDSGAGGTGGNGIVVVTVFF